MSHARLHMDCAYDECLVGDASPCLAFQDHCDCCQQRKPLPYTHYFKPPRNDTSNYCQDCYDVGCDLDTCELGNVPLKVGTKVCFYCHAPIIHRADNGKWERLADGDSIYACRGRGYEANHSPVLVEADVAATLASIQTSIERQNNDVQG